MRGSDCHVARRVSSRDGLTSVDAHINNAIILVSQSPIDKLSANQGVEEIWENGQAFRDLAARMEAITEQREGIEAERKVLSVPYALVSSHQLHHCLVLPGRQDRHDLCHG